jgi:probable F420-dependent oxidoreductase
MKVALNLLGITNYYGGAFAGMLDLAKLADAKGIDQVTIGEHLALFPDGLHKYPRGKFSYPLDYPYHEPIALLSAIAAVPRQIRLSTNIILAPLRPALLLAKQIATLDIISDGRAELAWGAGWHEEEFLATGAPFKGRFGFLEEQVEACRAVWNQAPASYHGKHVKFDNLYSMPLPPQRGQLPILFGMDATPRNVPRIARLADGWAPGPMDVELVAKGVREIKAALRDEGRNPDNFPIRATLRAVKDANGQTDIEASFATLPAYIEAGVTIITANVRDYCKDKSEFGPLIDRLVALKKKA